jgi:hypothetical protein
VNRDETRFNGTTERNGQQSIVGYHLTAGHTQDKSVVLIFIEEARAFIGSAAICRKMRSAQFR